MFVTNGHRICHIRLIGWLYQILAYRWQPPLKLAWQGAYKFGKMKFPEFSRHLYQFFPYNYNVKTQCNEPPYEPFRYLSCSNAEILNKFLRSMVTGSTHASHCVTQPIYARLVVGFRLHHRNIPSEFQISLSFPEFKKSQVFRSCKHPAWSGILNFVAAWPPTRPAQWRLTAHTPGPPTGRITDAREQNNTSQLGGPVITLSWAVL